MYCPICGSKLVTRYGPYGRFIGCSFFPRCGYSVPTKPLSQQPRQRVRYIRVVDYY